MTLVSVLITLVCIATIYFLLNYRHRQFFKKVNMPGPKTFPLIGSAYVWLQRNPDEFLDSIITLVEKYSTPLQLWLGNKLFIVISKPDEIQTILQNNKCLEKSILYKFTESVLGKGLITAPASMWMTQRKLVAPNFNTNMLQIYFDKFAAQSLLFADKLEKIGLNEIIFYDHILHCTVPIACATMTDVNMENLSDLMNQSVQAALSWKKTLKTRWRNIFLYPDFIFNLTATARKQQQCKNILHSFITEMIQQQKFLLNEMNSKTKSETSQSNKGFLHSLMEACDNKKCTQEMLYDNITTMLLAGAETSANAITFAVLMLANSPYIQEKVYKELWTIYGTKSPKSAPIKYEDLQHMDYLNRVIKETLRIFPVIPIIARHLTEDIQIGDIILPKDSDVLINFMTMHRSEKYWPNPLVFDPDRFLPEKIGTSNKLYMPFSVGIRNCIGMKYAMISMKVILATLIRTFIFKIDESIEIDKIKLNMDLTLSTVEPIKVKIEKRDLY